MHYRLRTVDEQIVGRLASSLRVRPATARCLAARGCVEPSDAQGFIDPRLAALRPPTGLAGLPRAVERLADAIQRNERIGVFGDYDVDGVTTAALLTSFFRAAGGQVEVAVARRDAGYGFQPAAAADFARQGCRVIVTGDCGTSDLAALAAAAAFGIDVIVVDHHTVPSVDKPHPSFALVNPFRADSTFPFRGMASVGLAFYVAAAVRTELRDRGHFRTTREPDVRELLDLVALGTIADLVPLNAENRILTALGLKRLRRSEQMRPGIAALLGAANVPEDRDVDERMIAWKIAPRINAPGRLGAAEPSLALLLADAQSAPERAAVLEAANKERRAIQDRVLAEALEMIERNGGPPSVDRPADFAKGSGAFPSDIVLGPDAPAIVVAGEGWPSGVVGIVAAKLVDKYQRPAFVVGIDPETGLGRGSARTAGGVDLYRALSEAWRDANVSAASSAAAASSATPSTTAASWRYGGHAAAAGFTIGREAMAALADALGVSCGKLAEGSGPKTAGTEIDAEVRLGEVDERLAQELAGLGPFGQANPPPLLVTRNARVTAVRRVGDGSHLKLTLEDGDAAGDRSPATRSAIAFGLGDREVEVGAHLDLAFLPTVSTWQGRRSAELEVHDFTPTGD